MHRSILIPEPLNGNASSNIKCKHLFFFVCVAVRGCKLKQLHVCHHEFDILISHVKGYKNTLHGIKSL